MNNVWAYYDDIMNKYQAVVDGLFNDRFIN
jgi:hypothetical protein